MGKRKLCKCGKAPATKELHPCPYAEDIGDNPEPVCDCCAKCAQECAWDI